MKCKRDHRCDDAERGGSGNGEEEVAVADEGALDWNTPGTLRTAAAAGGKARTPAAGVAAALMGNPVAGNSVVGDKQGRSLYRKFEIDG